MKVRMDFVSNSSSSSYILSIDQPMEDILCDLNNEFYKEDLIEDLEKRIEWLFSENNYSTKDGVFYGYTRKEFEDKIKEIEDDDWSSINSDDMKMLLEFCYDLKIESIGLHTTIECCTNMHNSYGDGPSEEFKRICLYFAFEHSGYKLTFKREAD